ncbi:MAG: response regulator [candidate division KSB1 bacterium]|nr:response regulator [candidate division KSB1 bacterium]
MAATAKRILIVDDEEDMTWSIARSLRKQNEHYEIICVNSSEEAVEVLKRLRLDLVITDVRMPDHNGYQLLKVINQFQPDLRVIIMSAWQDAELNEILSQRSGICFIEKPFDINTLKHAIREAFQNSGRFVHGRLIDMSLADIIRRNCQNKMNGYVHITNGKEKGVIYFRGGELVHAQVGNLEGENALLNALNWNDSRYATVLAPFSIKKSIHQDWKTLLQRSPSTH